MTRHRVPASSHSAASSLTVAAGILLLAGMFAVTVARAPLAIGPTPSPLSGPALNAAAIDDGPAADITVGAGLFAGDVRPGAATLLSSPFERGAAAPGRGLLQALITRISLPPPVRLLVSD